MDSTGLAPAVPLRLLPALALVAATASTAAAQHAETVLFGEASAEGLALPDERKAVHPLTAPYYNEDAFITSDLRGWWVRHDFPTALGGGMVNVFALQVRAALTENLQLVAYKDGYSTWDSGLIEDSGWFDVGAGVKWAFFQDWETDTHAAAGIGYELGVGDADLLQDDDEIRLWSSFNKGFDRLHLGANVNFTFPVGSEDALGDSERLSWHLHADYWVNETVSPVVEVNGFSTLSDGDNIVFPLSGVDVANLGGGDGEDVITAGLGVEFRVPGMTSLRVAHETPLTDNTDLYGHRWTLSAIWSF